MSVWLHVNAEYAHEMTARKRLRSILVERMHQQVLLLDQRIPRCIRCRAGKNLRFLKKYFRFLGFLGFFSFLGFNICTAASLARGTLDAEIRSRRRPINKD